MNQNKKQLGINTLLLVVIALLALVGWWIPCPLWSIAHIPCLTCGMTRSLGALLQLDWRLSLQYHPLTIPFGVTVFVVMNRALFSVNERWLKGWLWTLGAAFLVFWALRLLSGPQGWALLG